MAFGSRIVIDASQAGQICLNPAELAMFDYLSERICITRTDSGAGFDFERTLFAAPCAKRFFTPVILCRQ
jgi:hypothetical protein